MASQKMGLLYGLEKPTLCLPRQNRWLFEIPGVSADDSPGTDALPPLKSSRPNLAFKEMEIKHLIEDVYYPCKPDWKPIQITLFDIVKSTNPVWDWISQLYQVSGGNFLSPIQSGSTQQSDMFIKTCYLKMFNGCGDILETWVFEDSWPNAINFQTLDMGSGSYMTVDLTLRYARAYLMA